MQATDEKIEALMGAGLTLNESKVYLALIELNMANAVKIAQKSGVHRVNVYDSLEKLMQKGLANTIKVEGKKRYRATDPHVLSVLMEEKANRLCKLIPQLELVQQLKEMETQVGVYEGASAMRNIYHSFLDIGKERIVFGGPKTVFEAFSKFLEAYHEKRIRMKRKLRIIYSAEAKERVKRLNRLPFTEARILEREYGSPVSTSVCGDQIVINLWSKNPIFIVVVNKKIADAYRRYFEVLWEKARKP